jgi:perosamine synthetase
LADACHALGGAYRGRPVGSVADLTVFSFHPVKAITTGEGGALVTADSALAERARRFRNHGISSDCHQRQREGAWFYEIVDLGFNYRITDLQCALGLSQLDKLSGWIERRQALARHYDEALRELPGAQPLVVRAAVSHAYHLYVIQLDTAQVGPVRAQVFAALRARGIGVNVHYIPVHLHPFYRQRFGTGPGLCPVAEAAYERILSLPLFPAMTERDVDDVVAALRDACQNAGGPR